MIRWGDEIVPGDLIELDWNGEAWSRPVKARCLEVDFDGWICYRLEEDTEVAKTGHESACLSRYARRAAE